MKMRTSAQRIRETMTEQATVRIDEGDANRRILSQHARADYRRVEQAGIKRHTDLRSPEAKRLFARFFHVLQLNAHFVSEIARVHLSPEVVEKVEQTLRKRLDELMAAIDRGTAGAQALFAANGVTRTATYDTVALDLEVGVISSFGRRYLEALQALDRLMPMLRTLEIYEVISPHEVDRQRAQYKRSVRRVATAARELAIGLRKRMNAPAVESSGGAQENGTGTSSLPERASEGRRDEERPIADDGAEDSSMTAPVTPFESVTVRQDEEKRAA